MIMQYSFAGKDFGRDQVKTLLTEKFTGSLSASWKGYQFKMHAGEKSKTLYVKGTVHANSVAVYKCGGKNRKSAKIDLKKILGELFV